MAKIYGQQSNYISRNEVVNRKISKVALGFVALISGIAVAFVINLILGESDINIKIIIYLIFAIIYFGLAWWFLLNYSTFELSSNKFLLGQQGEDDIFAILSQLPDEYIVWRDLKIKYGNIDYVVARANEVFCIEAKNHKGKIGFNGHALVRNGYPFIEGDLLQQATREYFELRDIIENRSFQTIPIISIIVFANKESRILCNQYKPVKNGIYVLQGRILKGFIEHYHRSTKPINIPVLEHVFGSLVS